MPQWLKDILPLLTLVLGFLLSQWGQYFQEERKFKRDFRLELWKKKVERIEKIKNMVLESTDILFSEEFFQYSSHRLPNPVRVKL